MTNEDAIALLRTTIGNHQSQIDALNAAITVLQNGYASDQTAIDTAVSSAKESIATTLKAALATVEPPVATP